jgi:L-ascorbate metabolism protein UlaG (beta-lactamase superfamily)
VPVEDLPAVEALVISHPFADHLNFPTLRKLPRELPVYAPSVAHGFMRHLARFRDVTHLGNGARGAPAATVGNVELIWCRATAPLDTTHNALIFRGRRTGTTVVYSPHGVLRPSATLEALERHLDGRLDALLLSFTLLDLPGYLGGVANLGERAAVDLTAHLKPRHVMGTHDAPKPDVGFISRVERIVHCPDMAAALGDRAPGTTPVVPRLGEAWRLD